MIIPKKRWQFPLAIEREYAKDLVNYVKHETAAIESFLPELVEAVWEHRTRQDADEEEKEESKIPRWLVALMAALMLKLSRFSAKRAIERTFAKVKQHTAAQFNGIMESIFGSRPKPSHTEKAKTELDRLKEKWVADNLKLIKSVDRDIIEKTQGVLVEKIIQASDKKSLLEELTQDIRKITGAAEKRAALIGADQVGKLNGRIVQYRQQSAGIDRYIWVTAGDRRVRPAHRRRHGVSYRWDSPPDGGHPGEAIRCRCVAQPLIDEQSFRLTPKPGSFTTPVNGGTIAINVKDVGEAQMPVSKIFKYALDPNSKGRDKAIAFKEALGYEKSNGWHLIESVSQHINEYPLESKGKNQYGERFQVRMQLKGPNGKTATVITGWLNDEKTGLFRLTSIYVDKKKAAEKK